MNEPNREPLLRQEKLTAHMRLAAAAIVPKGTTLPIGDRAIDQLAERLLAKHSRDNPGTFRGTIADLATLTRILGATAKSLGDELAEIERARPKAAK